MTRLRPGLARSRELLRERRDLGAQALGLLVGRQTAFWLAFAGRATTVSK